MFETLTCWTLRRTLSDQVRLCVLQRPSGHPLPISPNLEERNTEAQRVIQQTPRASKG